MLAVHCLSKRDNFAGARIGSYAGDAELVHYLREVRKHAGLMPPGPVQAAAIVALGDDAHVEVQRERYQRRLTMLARSLGRSATRRRCRGGRSICGYPRRATTRGRLRVISRRRCGIVVSPGEFYGQASTGYFRIAAVQPDERIALAAARAGL